MKNSQRFTTAYNRIDAKLREQENSDRYLPFSELVVRTAKHNYVVRRFEKDLKMLGNLRNAIIHNETRQDYVIAEPHDSTVSLIERIEAEISKPKEVIPMFSKDVKTFETDHTLSDVLRVIKDQAFSQFPVYKDGEFAGLLTENGITNFLARHVEEELISLPETAIEMVLSLEEAKNNCKFISRHTSVYEAKELFKNEGADEFARLDALLITHHGRKTEKLLGMITAWDITQID
ncbi:CBS domain-containing protein [Salipaludibacillus aurantiacus]|uniref:CBS domain-containing protein n=1 Tax=Salipaludibacillus aurantiacus TaxID=1601833 RepID=A0A1H9S609_9BACI|nr:CBS domain-containing protein [Salipaludibacillus aurantiacus]SER80410.1 CBS domain-containing protein [Salipaludibacillus aurantiacus]